ncbi:MAG: hypothetical protein LBK26_04075 [Rickettsiales bacterium]|jgi:hypothetical protein|nr:hypothetical protein [Rickettsiales bacterium]
MKKGLYSKSVIFGLSACALLSSQEAKSENAEKDSVRLVESVDSLTSAGIISCAASVFSVSESLAGDFHDIEKFLARIKSDGPKINRDSLANLEFSEIAKFVESAKRRPARVEIETVPIKSADDMKRLFETGSFVQAGYNQDINIIEINVLAADFKPAENPGLFALIQSMNAELPFLFVHEKKHEFDAARKRPEFLNFDRQMPEYEFYFECAGYVSGLLAKRLALLRTRELQTAGPIDSISSGEISRDEADALVMSMIKWLKENGADYARRQIPGMVAKDVRDAFANLRKSKEAPILFQEQVRRLFQFETGNLLDICGPELRKTLAREIESLANGKRLKKDLAKLSARIPAMIQFIDRAQRARFAFYYQNQKGDEK